MESGLAIDPNLKEAEGTTHTAPVLHNGPRAGRARGQGANTMKAVQDDSGAFVLVPSNQHNGENDSYPDDALDESPGTAATEPTPKVKRPRGRPRKSKEGVDANGSATRPTTKRPRPSVKDENESGDALPRPPKILKTVGDIDVAAVDPGPEDEQLPESGPLVKKEQHILDAVMKTYREAWSMEQRQVNDMIQNTNRAQSEQTKELWALLYDALPQRPHVSVMRATRRRYHNYQVRGKWSPADDEILKEAHAGNPGKWVKIGSMLGRMPEDCRDRWRNYLSCGDERKTDDWSEKEETELQKAVEECISAARQAAKDRAKEQGHAFREQDWESYVNFNNVSEKMKFTRSRLQCYTHWKVMQRRDGAEHPERGSAKTFESKNPTRQGRALAKYERMRPADKFVILRQIAETQAQEESEINWKAISRDNSGGKWSTRERKEAFAKMKGLVPPQESLSDTIEAICEFLMTNHPDEFILPDPANNDGIDDDTTQALLQEEIDASPSVTKARSRGKQYVPASEANALDDDNRAAADSLRQIYGSENASRGLVIEEMVEQDIQDLNVARALQGIAQLSQERGDFRESPPNS